MMDEVQVNSYEQTAIYGPPDWCAEDEDEQEISPLTFLPPPLLGRRSIPAPRLPSTLPESPPPIQLPSSLLEQRQKLIGRDTTESAVQLGGKSQMNSGSKQPVFSKEMSLFQMIEANGGIGEVFAKIESDKNPKKTSKECESPNLPTSIHSNQSVNTEQSSSATAGLDTVAQTVPNVNRPIFSKGTSFFQMIIARCGTSDEGNTEWINQLTKSEKDKEVAVKTQTLVVKFSTKLL
jgi:hypothetical protein